ncbi:MAG: hypothetical protein GTN74_02740, partial [Proteobacteria bacterium]|nr:hypothetical protein [Pseudomonadota bacterium]NIS68093.1 hypothetical protein [Pseudomonadota bacterium]
GRPLYSRRLAEWHFWLTLGGLTIFMTSLWLAGLIQGQHWLAGGIRFLETTRVIHPYFAWRLMGGLLMWVGQVVFAYNIWRTAFQRAPSRKS